MRHLWGTTWNWGPQFRWCHSKVFLFYALVAILFGIMKPFWQFGRGPYEEHLGEIILNFGQQFRCHLKIFSFHF